MMGAMDAVLAFVIALLSIMVVMYLSPIVGETMGDTLEFEESISTVNVHFDNSLATNFNVGVYDETDEFIVGSANGTVINDTWCAAVLDNSITIINGHRYSFIVNADANFTISSDSDTNYINETITTYGTLPTSIDSTGDTAQLSIYASYI